MARELKNILIHEVSLVDMPANRRKFAVIKRSENTEMDELRKLIEAFTGKELDDEIVSKAVLGTDVLKALKDQLTMVEKYRDDLPADVVSAIGSLSARAAFGITKSEDDADKDKDKDVDGEDNKVNVEEFVDQVVEKAGAKFSKATQELLSGLLEKFEAVSKEIESLKGLMDVKKNRAASDKDEDDADDEPVDAETIAKMIKAQVERLTG